MLGKILVKPYRKCECCNSEIEIDLLDLLLKAKQAKIKIKGKCKNCQNIENISLSDIDVK